MRRFSCILVRALSTQGCICPLANCCKPGQLQAGLGALDVIGRTFLTQPVDIPPGDVNRTLRYSCDLKQFERACSDDRPFNGLYNAWTPQAALPPENRHFLRPPPALSPILILSP